MDIEVGFDWSFVGIAWELELEEVVDSCLRGWVRIDNLFFKGEYMRKDTHGLLLHDADGR